MLVLVPGLDEFSGHAAHDCVDVVQGAETYEFDAHAHDKQEVEPARGWNVSPLTQDTQSRSEPVGEEEPTGHGSARTLIVKVAVDDMLGEPRSVATIAIVICVASALYNIAEEEILPETGSMEKPAGAEVNE